MPKVTFKLLQTPMIMLDDKPVLLPFKKAEALLYCLALKKTLSREQAANLLWDTDDAQVAKKNLRHTLYTIKKAVHFELIVSPKKHLLTLNPELQYDIDYDNFMHRHNFSLYEGELLYGFALKNADAFENWLEMERIEFKTFYLQQLYAAMLASAKKEVAETETLFAKYVKTDPLDERVYQVMMECYQQNGLYYKGIKVYQTVSKLLNAELGIAPCAELAQLHRELLSAWTEASADEPEQPSVQIIGRKEEMQQLMRHYRSFLLGNPTALLIMGDNGVGKTYLVNHFLDSIGEDACVLLKTICFQAEKEFILQPWNTIMLQLDRYIKSHQLDIPESYIGYINTLFPLFGDYALSTQVPEDVVASYNYRTARNSILKLFSHIGAETPILLFFDNIQFMDSLSLDLLSLIIRERNPNIFCICTCPDLLAPQLQKQINSLLREKFLAQLPLLAFHKQDVFDIITDRLGAGALNEQILSHIYEDSEGNGFFLDMLLGYLSAENNAITRLPSNPQDILLERLEELSTDARQMLDTISVCPESAALELIEYIFNRDTLGIIELTDELKQRGLIRERVSEGQIRFQFRHAKMQDFVHSQLSPSKRRLLHDRVASFYELPEQSQNNSWYQRIIYHYAQAGNDAKVLRYKILSLGDYSRYHYELYPVLQPHKDAALEAPKQLTKYFDELTNELVRIYNYRPNAVDFAELETKLYLAIGKYCISQGLYKKGLGAINRCLAQTEYLEEHPQIHISCLRQLTFYGIQVWDPPLMKQNIEQSMQLAKEKRLGVDYAIECRLYGLYLMMCGRYDESTEQLAYAITLFDSATLDGQNYVLNLAACFNYLGEVNRMQQRFSESIELYDRAIALCNEPKYSPNPTFFSNKGRALLALGNIAEAKDALLIANRLYEASNIIMGRAITQCYCSLLAAQQENFFEAKKLLAEAQKSAETLASPMALGILQRTKAMLLQNFGAQFSDVITESFEHCVNSAKNYLSGLCGAYEAELSLDMPRSTR